MDQGVMTRNLTGKPLPDSVQTPTVKKSTCFVSCFYFVEQYEIVDEWPILLEHLKIGNSVSCVIQSLIYKAVLSFSSWLASFNLMLLLVGQFLPHSILLVECLEKYQNMVLVSPRKLTRILSTIIALKERQILLLQATILLQFNVCCWSQPSACKGHF